MSEKSTVHRFIREKKAPSVHWDDTGSLQPIVSVPLQSVRSHRRVLDEGGSDLHLKRTLTAGESLERLGLKKLDSATKKS